MFANMLALVSKAHRYTQICRPNCSIAAPIVVHLAGMAITGSALRSKGCPGDTDKIATWLHQHDLFCFMDLAYVKEPTALDGESHCV